MIDTRTPCLGPFRLPNDNERRCRLIFKVPFRDCVDVCEMNPDLEEKTDATMRMFRESPNMLRVLKCLLENPKNSAAWSEAAAITMMFEPPRFPVQYADHR